MEASAVYPLDLTSPLPALPPWPLPLNEAARLEALHHYKILDSDSETVFDDVVAIAARLAEVPVSLISLVDAERQWFKARVGFPSCETPKEVSFCAHVVAENREIICEDARLDPRFAQNPLTTEKGVRFYAGFPLRTSEGFVLGTLCLVDFTPRTLSETHAATLRVLADQVVAQMELRRLLVQQEEALTLARSLADDLRVSEARLRAAFDHGPMPMARLGDAGVVEEANPAFRRFLARRARDLEGHALSELVHPDDRCELARGIISSRRPTPEPVELRLARRDGSFVHAELAFSAVPSAAGEPWVLVQLADLTARKEREAHLENIARRDGLTGLRNREGLRLLLQELTDPAAADALPAALMFVDLDGFKAVNDSFGHDAGDAVLRTVAERLARLTPPRGGAARLGGDEFVLVVPHATDPALAAAEVLHQITDSLAHPIHHEGLVHRIGASVGVALLAPGDDPLEAIRRADGEMYEEKRWRKERRLLPEVERTPHSLALDEMIRTDRLRLVYQPVVDLTTRTITGVEALLRPFSEDGLPIPPMRFVEEAEASGDIHHLTRWILQSAASEIQRLRAEVPGAETLTLGVNLPPLHLDDPSFAVDLEAILERVGLPPEALVLEITEAQLVPDTPAPLQVLQALRGLGVGLAVDDFGTGFASVSYLQNFPFTVLKIDRSLTTSLTLPGRAGDLARGVYRLAAALELNVVAEGVETPHHLAAVTAEGCSLVQGFLFARPLTPDALTSLLADPRELFHLS